MQTKLCTKVSKKRKKEKKKKKRKGAEQPENFRPEDSGLPALRRPELVPPPLLPHLRLYLFPGTGANALFGDGAENPPPA